jgi:ATP-GRASP peptide maturase of grasp-with-spasm system
MIIILSKHADTTTDEVCKYLKQENANYLRLNDDLFNKNQKIDITIKIDSLEIDYQGNNFLIYRDENHIIWNRKFGFFQESEMFQETSDNLPQEITNYLASEYYSFIEILIGNLNATRVKWLNPPMRITKIEQLGIAKKVGLNIPNTIITNSKKQLSLFLESNPDCIVKPMQYGKTFYIDNFAYPLLTNKLEYSVLDEIGSNFFPCIVQNNILKEFEIRVFVLGQKIYGMAIFSQNDIQTQTDFRNYNVENPNRMIPYKLPTFLEKLILQFMSKSGYNTGSIDLIKSIDGEYYFLEINPSGQFGMVSINCNYNLEGKVAEYLLKYGEVNQ